MVFFCSQIYIISHRLALLKGSDRGISSAVRGNYHKLISDNVVSPDTKVVEATTVLMNWKRAACGHGKHSIASPLTSLFIVR